MGWIAILSVLLAVYRIGPFRWGWQINTGNVTFQLMVSHGVVAGCVSVWMLWSLSFGRRLWQNTAIGMVGAAMGGVVHASIDRHLINAPDFWKLVVLSLATAFVVFATLLALKLVLGSR